MIIKSKRKRKSLKNFLLDARSARISYVLNGHIVLCCWKRVWLALVGALPADLTRLDLFFFFVCFFSMLTTFDDWLDSMNGRWSIVKRLYRLSAVSYFDDKYFCDCVNCSASCRPVCRCCTRALSSVAYEHFVCDASIVLTMIDFYCMVHIENLHRVMQRQRVTLRRPQQQQRQQHYDDSNRLIDSALTLKSALLLRSSDDLTTSNKDDVISPLKICSHTITRSCFNFKLIFFYVCLSNFELNLNLFVFFLK